jgi:hypothetical protein
MSVHVDLSLLDEPLFEDDYEWVRDNAPIYLERVQSALERGATPQGIYQYYMKRAPHRHAFWLRLKHAALHLQQRRA